MAMIVLILLACLSGVVLGAPSEPLKGLSWMTNWEQAVEVAKERNKLIVLDLYTNWCSYCRMMDVQTYGDPLVIQDLGPEYVWLRLNAETEEDGRQAQRRFRVMGYPTTLLIEPEEGLFEKTSGFLTAEQLGEELNRHRESLKPILELRARVRIHPESNETMRELAAAYMEQRHYAGAERMYHALIQADSDFELDKSYFSLAISLAQQGKERQALQRLDTLRNRFPHSKLLGHAMALQGELHLNLGNRSEAASIWREYLSLFSDHPMAKRIMEELKRIES